MKYFAGYVCISGLCSHSDEMLGCFSSFRNAKEDGCFNSNRAFFKVNDPLITEAISDQKFICHVEGTVSIVGDVTVHNRTEIELLLAVSNTNFEYIDDLLLLLRCYLKWGEECLQYIVGDFSFAIWDAKKKVLFSAVDHLGARSFYYRILDNGTILFSNKLREIVASSKYQIQINKEYLIDYLLSVFSEPERTVYSDILRIPPGSYLLVNTEGVKCHQYWKPVVGSDRYRNDERYFKKLKELIVEAVQCRIEKGKKYGVLLSGGLDSSAVTCIAETFLRKIGSTLFAFSQVLPDNYCGEERDEKDYINQVAECTDVQVKYSTKTNGMSQGAFDSYFQFKYTLPMHPFFCTSDPLHQMVSVENTEVLLTGNGGDHIASNFGDGYLVLLAKKGKWLELWRLLKKKSSVEGRPISVLLKRKVIRPLTPSLLLKYYRVIKGTSQPHLVKMAFIKKNIVEGLQLKKKVQRNSEMLHSASISDPRTEIVMWLKNDVFHPIYELDEYLFDYYSLDSRHPLLDKRIIEYILSVPPVELVRDGWSRSLFRRSMGGVIPGKIQSRIGKLPFCRSSTFVQLYKSREYVHQVLDRKKSIAWDIIDREQLREKFDSFLQNQDSISSPEAFAIGRCVAVASFLQWHDM